MDFDANDLKRQIPFYLTAEDQTALLDQLKAFTEGKNPQYFLSDYDNEFSKEMLQGDGWPGLQLFLFDTGNRKHVRGVVLSNSCDIDPNNKRDVPSRVVFAPLVKLSTYRKLLDENKIDIGKIEAKMASVKSQRTTNLFYLPAGGPLSEEYVIRLDDLHTMPRSACSSEQKLFTLSMVGFYIFVLKISVHFCRLQENVNRSGTYRTTSK